MALVNDPPNWVSYLIEATTATWKEDLIRSVFLPVDAQTILAIPLCTIPIADFWAWSHERTGRFSVRPAYKMVINIRENGANGNVGSTGAQGAPEGKAWTSLWHTKVPSNIKVFLWKLARNSMPSMDVLHHRHMATTRLCALCGQNDSWRHAIM